MSMSDVERALIDAAVTSLGTTPVEHPNTPFVPPANAKWAQVAVLPAVPEVSTLGSTGQDMATGILQITIRYPVGSGTEAAKADTEAIRTAFSAGTVLAYSEQSVKIVKCGRSSTDRNDKHFVVFNTIYWYAWISR